jgi:hypothetical protein
MESEFYQPLEFKHQFQNDSSLSFSQFEECDFYPFLPTLHLQPYVQQNLEEEENEFINKIFFHKNEKKTKETTSELPQINKGDNGIFKIDKFLGNKKNREKKPLFKKIGTRNHDKYDIDNIITVVQNHYINFIVMFVNYFLEEQGINEKFIKISYEEKRKVNKENFEILKKKCLYEILQMKISPKNKLSPEDNNKNLYNKVKNLPIIKDILNLNYLYFFQNVYYKSERNIILNIDGMDKPFKLSDRKLVLYKERLSSFSNEYYKTLFNDYVKEKYFSD